jgi:hypothetical protein
MKYIRYTKGPESLPLGDVLLMRADTDEHAYGWVKVTDDLAREAVDYERVHEYGFESAKLISDCGEVTEPDYVFFNEQGCQVDARGRRANQRGEPIDENGDIIGSRSAPDEDTDSAAS